MKMSSASKPILQLLKIYLLFAALFATGRSILIIYYFDRISDAGYNLVLSMLYGLRLDSIIICMILLPIALILHLTPSRFTAFFNQLLRFYLLVMLLIVIYMENATLPFIDEYDVRPNIIFVNYLKYPKEVFGTIWASYKLELLVAFIMMAIAAVLYLRKTPELFLSSMRTPLLPRSLFLLPILIVLFIGIRSSFGHRPANPSDAIISDNRLLNEITKNSLHSVIYSAATEAKHGGSTHAYGNMNLQEAYRRVRKSLSINIENPEADAPFHRLVRSHFPSTQPKNLVILLQESMGAQFVYTQNNLPEITPRLHALMKHGIEFRHLYSDGTRSIRGISGVVAGFLPVPGSGVVKRSLSQDHFFTVGALLNNAGYHSSFIYGGESRFDNMKSWFSGNGFDEIYDEDAFTVDDFHGTWGVDDLTVLQQADRYYRSLHNRDQHFVSVVFSTTNHKPFDFPDSVIEPIPGVPHKSVENAIKYADHAIGEFIEMAKRSGYYDDTVFLIVADHNIRVYGDDILPVGMFRIPGLILGGGVEPKVIKHLTSQPDTLATALDLIGSDFEYPILGRSVFNDIKNKSILMQYHDIYGLRRGDRMAVLQPDNPATTYRIDTDDHLHQTEHDAELERDALAFIVTLDALYNKRQYH